MKLQIDISKLLKAGIIQNELDDFNLRAYEPPKYTERVISKFRTVEIS